MAWSPETGSLEIAQLEQHFAARTLTPSRLIEALQGRLAQTRAANVWITLADRADLMARARALEQAGPAGLPLYGIPYAVKDNIDVAGLPTTAACPDFSYRPDRSATAVARLEADGAICLGKTNLDQFATGLSGVRSPYGACASVFNRDYVAGGSSSGSALAVAAGLASFALGTDTGGSGRIPAGFNNIVGLKPTRGVIGAGGLVPNCRTLDCVSIFALTAADAHRVLLLTRGSDARDPYSSAEADSADLAWRAPPARFRFGVPAHAQREFCGDRDAETLFEAAIARLAALGGRPIEIDFAPFRAVSDLMFEGPWVAERYAALRGFVDDKGASMLPVTRAIIESARRWSASDLFDAQYRLQALKQATQAIWSDIDLLMVPTAPTALTLRALEQEPLHANNLLGTYSYFVNLLDLAAIAVPNGFLPSRVAMGITMIAPPLSDGRLAGLAGAYQARLAIAPGGAAAS
jgi:allophanate hydrolase